MANVAGGKRRWWQTSLVANVAGGKRRWWQTSLVAVSCALIFSTAKTGATDFFTTNTAALRHFWAAIESSNRPVTVVSFGDSMADSYRSMTYHLMNKLRTRFGTAGYSLNNYGNTTMYRLFNGAFVVDGGPYWFSYYFGLPVGAAVWWDNQTTPGGTHCNSAGIFFVTQTNGGQFRLSISTNGGPWTTKLLLNGYSASPTGQFTNLALTPNSYRLRVDSEVGTNYIIGSYTVLTQSSGIHAVFMDQAAIPLSSVTNVPIAIRAPIFAALKPDLLVWHMKEPIPPLYAGMVECEQWWSNSAPDCDILYIGTPWLAVDANSTTTLDQNTVVRSIALRYHRAYVDLMQPLISYPWMVSQGFMADETHLSSYGGSYCANLLWNDVGFFALGLNRRLTLQRNGAQMQLSYNTSANARYRLEFSTNLSHWSAILTNPVATTSFTTNFPMTTASAFYRLGLAPP